MRSKKLILAEAFNTKYIIATLVALMFLFAFSSCKTKGTALRHYKKVAAETQIPLTPEKKNALATSCQREFPIIPITITKDSVVTKLVKVVDNAMINKLKAQIALLKSQNKNLNLDSLYEFIYDSALNNMPPCQEIIRYKTETKTIKDTIGNYFKALEQKALKDTLDKRTSNLVLANATIEKKDKEIAEANKKIDKWFWYFIFACIIGIGTWGVYGYFKLKNSYKLPI